MSCCSCYLQVFAIDDFYFMVLELLQSKTVVHAFTAMKFIHQLMNADFQQYGAKIALLDKDKPMELHIARILFDKALLLLQPLRHLDSSSMNIFVYIII